MISGMRETAKKRHFSFLTGFLLLILFAILSYAAGLRLHPESIHKLIDKTAKRHYVRLDIGSAGSFYGELMEANAESVRVLVQGGQISFQRSEISQITDIPESEARLHLPDEAAILPPVTFRQEDNLVRLWRDFLNESQEEILGLRVFLRELARMENKSSTDQNHLRERELSARVAELEKGS